MWLLPAFFPAKELEDGVLSYPVSCALIGIGTRGEADAAMGNGQKGMDSKRECVEQGRGLPSFSEVLCILETAHSTKSDVKAQVFQAFAFRPESGFPPDILGLLGVEET